ncbi:hypothetical protein OHB37_18410 [Streptomyces albidoflavus]|uniref:hypothetical protein n=1 Tax=Streptomyces TaxID=1883 RepID=UPI002036F604|nr:MULTISPECIES: hypothetical protein [unclassified Streptomyces]WSB16022.1 hypothetical protein OHB37_18410 [Streptomyces albidoflavus]WSD41588.1 hypothetical protein OG919_18405 [Streptomyces albidoflavus]
MNPVGFFSELSPGWGLPESGSIRDAVRSTGEADEAEIASYLLNGTEIWSEMSAGPDVLDTEGGLLTGIGSLYTDGEWIWRGDLSHYVSRHHVALPRQFLTHIREANHSPPKVPEKRLVTIATEDLGISLD